ncbi:hypothetical protein [Cognaticolwellia beringensis]|uniref:Swiss Army Knife 2H phosphoesterase domain-containing protein n=1 Tax=Cognaticolwellia beringensis TaxID=1967665 RepID=A0A222GCB4_9GAMM|nr:hypothetical protein [Cognaticolwellia beringensis]ASP49004.1 hypothetical protein B5D82_15235 [Cognaticolwellia beringensis]
MKLGSRTNINIKFTAITFLCISSIASATTALDEHTNNHQDKSSITSGHKATLITGGNIAENSNTEEPHKPLTAKQKATPLARVLAQSDNQLLESPFNEDRTLNLEISELRDNSGLVYLGGKVSIAELSRYLEQLKTELGEEQFAIYRQHQAARDQQTFHVTLVNPYEYQTIDKAKLTTQTQFRVILHGLGRVENDDKKSYFVVASSPDGQFIRQKLLLKNKDFHVTLGFFPDDIYGVSKGRDTLMNK